MRTRHAGAAALLLLPLAGLACQYIVGLEPAMLDPNLCWNEALGHVIECTDAGADGGTGGGCETAESCADPGDPCKARTCVDHACGVATAPSGTPCAGGICHDGACCIPRACTDLGLQCGAAPDGCGGMLDCNDGVKNGDETDVDCGGSVDAGALACPPCAQANACVQDADCATGFCVDGVCCESSCDTQCYACGQAGAVGLCRPLPHGMEDGSCSLSNGDRACDGVGACRGFTGAQCKVGSNCFSGTCSFGLCK
jgi:hypothetical protein